MQRLWRQKRDIDYFIVNIATQTRPRQTKRVRQGLQAAWNGYGSHGTVMEAMERLGNLWKRYGSGMEPGTARRTARRTARITSRKTGRITPHSPIPLPISFTDPAGLSCRGGGD